MTKRVAVIVYLDLDAVPGAFHTEESAVNNTRGILENAIPHYNPEVVLAPGPMQPAVEVEDLKRYLEEKVTFDTWANAFNALVAFQNIAREDKFATIADLNDVIGRSSHYAHHYWGWLEKDLDETTIVHSDFKYHFNLLEPRQASDLKASLSSNNDKGNN